MKAVGELFKNSAKAPVKRIRVRAILEEGTANEVTYSSDDVLVSLTISSSGALFESAISAASLKLLGTDYNLDGKMVRLCFDLSIKESQILTESLNSLLTEDGIELWSGSHFETVDYGLFVIHEDETSYGKESTTFKLYSLMYILQTTKYEKGDIIFPCTIVELAQSIASKFDLGLTNMDDLPNISYVINDDLYANISDITYRDIVAEIAGATATMATIDNANKVITFRPPQTNVQENLTYDNLKTANIGDSYGPVNSLVLARVPQEDNISLLDQASINLNGLTEVKLANNEIMDDDREVFINEIFSVIDGIQWVGFDATTEGHGWYEVGDRLKIITDGGEFETIVTDINLTFDGGVKESLKGIIPDKTTTDYALSGSIAKTIHNTEIKVDKQGQQIISIVEEQTQFEQATNTNFTNITQNISSVVTSVQNSGGNNLIKNSAMYMKDDQGAPLNWLFSGAGTYTITPSADASASGSLSGQIISLLNKTASQIVTVKPDNDGIAESLKIYYSFSCRIKKAAAGSCTVRLSDGTDEGVWTIEIGNGQNSNYGEFAIEGILPHSTELTVSVSASSDAEFYITDMMLAVGNYRTQWTQANGEFSNSQVQIDIDGVTVKNNNLSGSYTRQTPQEVEVYSGGQLAARISGEKISANSGEFNDEINMPPLKLVAQSDGWAFVEKEN